MKRVRLQHVAIALAVAGIALGLKLGDYDLAETKLSAFYARMEAADFPGARRVIDEAVRLWPSNARYHGWRGYVASQTLPSQCPARGGLDQIRAAAADFRRALELNGRDAVAHHNLAWLQHLLGQDAEARREWEQAVALDPSTAVYHLSLGIFLEEQGEAAAADREYGAALELAPATLDSPFFARFRERYPARAGAVAQRARANLERRLGPGDDPILKARLGKFLLAGGELERAAEMLESAARELPNLPMVWFNLGEARRRQGRQDEAWACYGKAKFLDGGLAGPPLRMGLMYAEAGRKKEAVEQLRGAVQKWARVKPVTAGHNTRLYGGVPQPIDDLLPTTLVWYTTGCQASEAYAALSGLAPENKVYGGRARTCESLPGPHGGGER